MSDVIRVEQLCKVFRLRGNKNLLTGLFDPRWQEHTAVDSISFTVKKGEAVAFLGPNGAGKTTTTKMLSGLMHPSSGKLDILGYTPFERKREYLMRIGLVMGNKAGLNWDLTARQSFWLLQNIYQIPKKTYLKRLEHLSTMLRVDKHLDTQLRRLSLGERMKLELIGAILHEPEMLFLDEPTIGLDIEAKNTVRDFLKTIQREQGTTLLLTSHDMDDVEEVCERVLVIAQGTIVHDGSLAALNRAYHDFRYMRLRYRHQPPLAALKKFGEILENGESILLKIERTKLAATLAALAKQNGLDDINIETVPLEQIMADIYHSK